MTDQYTSEREGLGGGDRARVQGPSFACHEIVEETGLAVGCRDELSMAAGWVASMGKSESRISLEAVPNLYRGVPNTIKQFATEVKLRLSRVGDI